MTPKPVSHRAARNSPQVARPKRPVSTIIVGIKPEPVVKSIPQNSVWFTSSGLYFYPLSCKEVRTSTQDWILRKGGPPHPSRSCKAWTNRQRSRRHSVDYWQEKPPRPAANQTYGKHDHGHDRKQRKLLL